MRRSMLLGLSLVMISSGVLVAAPFEPMVQAGEGADVLTVKTPDSRSFESAEAGRAYPYGSQFRAGSRGTARLVLSEGNHIQLAADTACTLEEGATEPSRKTLSLDSGSVSIVLEEGFRAANALRVVTQVATVEVLGSTLTVDAMSENDLDTAGVKVQKGSVKVMGPHFEVLSLDAGDQLNVSTAKDGSYTLLENVAGEFSVEAKDADGNPMSIATQPGTIIKIWRRTSEAGKTLIVTILITGPDGSVEQAITYTEDVATPSADETTPEGEEKPRPELGETLLLTTTPTTTTTTSTTIPPPVTERAPLPQTTTTTVPSPTPVGLR